MMKSIIQLHNVLLVPSVYSLHVDLEGMSVSINSILTYVLVFMLVLPGVVKCSEASSVDLCAHYRKQMGDQGVAH